MSDKKFAFKVYASWQVAGEVKIMATSLDEAKEIAGEVDLNEFSSDYMSGSFEINEEVTKDVNRGVEECCKIEDTPEKDRPLLIGTIKTKQGKEYLEWKLRGIE